MKVKIVADENVYNMKDTYLKTEKEGILVVLCLKTQQIHIPGVMWKKNFQAMNELGYLSSLTISGLSVTD